MKKTLLAISILIMAVLIALPIFASAMPGDVNNDNAVDEKDAVALARYLAGWKIEIDETNADVTADGKVDENDAVLLARYLAGWNVELKSPEVPVTEHYAIYVAKSGNDETGNGTIEKPFATIVRASDRVKEVLAGDFIPEDITVNIREGYYSITETVNLTKEHSGSESCSITYRAYQNEKVVLTGAVEIDQSKLVLADDAVRNKIRDPQARPHIYAYKMEENGLVFPGTTTELSLYCNGDRMNLARFPNADAENGGFLTITDPQVVEGNITVQSWLEVGNVVKYWERVNGIKIYGYFIHDWANSEGSLVSYDSETNRVIVSGSGNEGGRYYYSNILEELDAPGEYYVDEDEEIIYIYVYDGMEDMILNCSQLDKPILKVDGADYVTVDGLAFSGNLSDGIKVDADHFTLTNCEIVNIKDIGADISGSYNKITNNHIHSIGGVGLKVVTDKFQDQIPVHTLVCNNHIHDFAEIHGAYNPGIWAYGTCLTVCHNEIHDSAAQAMLSGGNDAIFEYNEIYRVCRESGDAGAIYTGGWDSNNNVYRYNYIHDMMESNGGSPHAIYCDDEGAGKECYGNIIVNIKGNAYHMGGGHNNQVYNNIVINAAICYDNRGTGWQAPAIIYPTGTLWSRFYLSNDGFFCSRIWSLRYPWTAQMKVSNTSYAPSHLDVGDPYEVGVGFAGVQIRNNAICYLGHDGNYIPGSVNVYADSRDNIFYSTVEEMGFVDAANGNYTLKSDSVLFRDMPGFEDIPFDKIGRFSVSE